VLLIFYHHLMAKQLHQLANQNAVDLTLHQGSLQKNTVANVQQKILKNKTLSMPISHEQSPISA